MTAFQKIFSAALGVSLMFHGPALSQVSSADLTLTSGPMLGGNIAKTVVGPGDCVASNAVLTFFADLESGTGHLFVVTDTCGTLLKSFPPGACEVYRGRASCIDGLDHLDVSSRSTAFRLVDAEVQGKAFETWYVDSVETTGIR